MPEATPQDFRLLRLNTPLGYGTLLPVSFEGRERISDLFSFSIRCFTQGKAIPEGALAGKPVVLSLAIGGTSERHFHGVIAGMTEEESRQGVFRYEITVRPWFWFMDRASDCRIFLDKSAKEIADTLFEEYGFASDVEWRLSRTPEPREYCVQFNESPFAFISRLMEEEGIFYFFRHEFNRHVLTLCDDSCALPPCPGAASVRYHRADVNAEEDAVSSWEETSEVTPGGYAEGDYSFLIPRDNLTVYTGAKQPAQAAEKLERYVYPGRFAKRSEGEAAGQRRMEEVEAHARICSGAGNVGALRPGFSFELKEHYRPEANRRYVLYAVQHTGRNNFDINGGGSSYYSNQFCCFRAETPFRPPRMTPAPRMYGVHTAVVTSPSGQELSCDEYGRVTVRFHWDRRAAVDDGSSCKIRVAQSLSGNRWGTHALPRAGMEVIVEYLDGDPDRPLVTGCVPNADNMPPYALPEHRTRSGYKSRSTPGGDGFNEIRFEDRKGAEQLFLHAQRQFDLYVRADARCHVGGSLHRNVGSDLRSAVGKDEDHKTTKDYRRSVGHKYSLNVTGEAHVSAGQGAAFRSDAGMTLEANPAKGGMILKAGGNFIALKADGIYLSGNMIYLNSGGDAGGLAADPDTPDSPASADSAVSGGASPLPQARALPKRSAVRETIAQREALQKAAAAGAPFCAVCAEESAAARQRDAMRKAAKDGAPLCAICGG